MDIMAFNWVDWSIIGLIGLSTLVGIFRGFVREGLSLVVWILAFWLAFQFSNHIATDWIGDHVKNPSLREALAFAGIFVAVLIVGGLINFIISTAVHKTGLGGTDRIMGLIFGFVRGILVVAIVLLFVNLTPITQQTWYSKAQLPSQFTWLVKWIHDLIPASMQKYLQPQTNDDDTETPAKKSDQQIDDAATKLNPTKPSAPNTPNVVTP
ncbi:MAG: CvpA family protein [Legionellales bacterium]|nr:CvpA family protein [Legionellales bacterium]